MDGQAGAALRWARALVLGAVAFVAGVVAHVSAHGLIPGARSLVVLFLLVSAGTAVFLGRPASTRRVVGLLMAGQTFIHAGLTAVAGHAGDVVVTQAASATGPAPVPTAATTGRSGSLFDQYAAAVPQPHAPPVLPAWVQHLVADLTGPHALMAVAHLAAAAVVGWWLAAGERALWTLLRAAATTLDEALARLAVLVRVGAVAAAPAVPAAQRRTLRAEAGRPLTRALATVVARRGPPVLVLAA